MWSQTYGGTNYDIGNCVVETSDGGYAIAGYTKSFGAGGEDFWLVKTDADGNELWNKTYGGVEDDVAWSLIQTNDDGYCLAGSTHSFGSGGGDFWLVKTDALGNLEWNKTYGEIGEDDAYSLLQTTDGGYVLVGSTSSFDSEYIDVLLIKTDEYGVVPEAAWVVLPLLVTATLAIFIGKKKLVKKPS
jgi:predicted secreted protein